jgi:hypothetical protein
MRARLASRTQCNRSWRPRRESNPRTRICSPLRHHSATRPRPVSRGFRQSAPYGQAARNRAKEREIVHVVIVSPTQRPISDGGGAPQADHVTAPAVRAESSRTRGLAKSQETRAGSAPHQARSGRFAWPAWESHARTGAARAAFQSLRLMFGPMMQTWSQRWHRVRDVSMDLGKANAKGLANHGGIAIAASSRWSPIAQR